MLELQTSRAGVVDFEKPEATSKSSRHKVRTPIEGVSRLLTQPTFLKFDRLSFSCGPLDLRFLHGTNSLFDQSANGSQSLSQVSLRDKGLRGAFSQCFRVEDALDNLTRVHIVFCEPLSLFGCHVGGNWWQTVHRRPRRSRWSSEDLGSLILEKIVQLEPLQIGRFVGILQRFID